MPKRASKKKKSVKKVSKAKSPAKKKSKTTSVKKNTKKQVTKQKPVVMHQHKPEKIIIYKKQIIKVPVKQNFGKLKHTAHPNHWFILSSGKEIKTLREFAQDLGDMEDFVFEHHVNEHKNDFVAWVKDVFEDLDLAEKIGQEKNKKKMQLVIYEHILDKMW